MSDDVGDQSIKSRIASLLGAERKIGQESDESERSGRIGCVSESYSRLLKELVHSSFNEEEAENHWKKILDNYASMNDVLERDVGIRIAAYDYFLNNAEQFKHALLIDHGFFRKLRHTSLIDPLTGIFNRTYFELHIKKELKRAIRHNRSFSLLLLDFGGVGTPGGNRTQKLCDEILIRLTKLLKGSCREEDMLCRFGPEEFIYLLPEVEGEGAFLFAERILYRIREDRFFVENEVSASGGIAEYPADSRNIFSLIKCADSALYHAKARGKDKISFFRERGELSSIYDNLTGLYNGSHFESLLAREHARAVRHNLTYSILFLDIDRFKDVNDSEGFVFGDLALTQLSCLLSSKSRELDVLARIGGGQFALLLPETDGEAAASFADRLLAEILGNCGFNRLQFTFSCGIASYPYDGFDHREIAECAREACARAMKEGGGKVARCTHNRRSSKRYRRTIPIRYKLIEKAFTDSRQRDFVTCDISLHGVCCIGSEEIGERSSLVLLFKTRGEEEHLVILAKVAWSKQEGKSRYIYGLEFRETDEVKLARLKEVIISGEPGKP
jgi:diguanylate cyclase (GGDEF)-like protein